MATAKKTKSNEGIKPKGKRGGRRAGAGRKPNPITLVRPEVSALVNDVLHDDAALNALLASLAPRCIANLMKLANGGFERVEEKWQAVQKGPSNLAGDTPTEFELVEKKVSYAEPDRRANEYLLDRVLGRPKQAVEHSGPEGGAIPVAIFDAALKKVYGSSSNRQLDPPGGA